MNGVLLIVVALVVAVPVGQVIGWLLTRNGWPNGPRPAPFNWRVFGGPVVYNGWLKRL